MVMIGVALIILGIVAIIFFIMRRRKNLDDGFEQARINVAKECIKKGKAIMGTMYQDGTYKIHEVPCSHPGCRHHVTHPCEVCGRIWGRASK